MSVQSATAMKRGNPLLQLIGRFVLSRGMLIFEILLLILFLVFFAIPLCYFLLLSFFTYIQSGLFTTALTLSNYQRMVSDAFYLRILGSTFQLGLIVSIVCLVIGYPFAYFLGRSVSRWRNLGLALVVASLFTNLVVRTFGWTVLLADHGLINDLLMRIGIIKEPLDLIFNMTGVVVGEAQVQIPVFILLVAGVIQMIDPDLESAARVMGADAVQSFFAVIWPLSLRGIISGLSLVFALSISSYITPQFLSGGKIIFASLFINTLVTKTLNYPLAGALSMVLILTSLIVIGAMTLLSRKYK